MLSSLRKIRQTCDIAGLRRVCRRKACILTGIVMNLCMHAVGTNRIYISECDTRNLLAPLRIPSVQI